MANGTCTSSTSVSLSITVTTQAVLLHLRHHFFSVCNARSLGIRFLAFRHRMVPFQRTGMTNQSCEPNTRRFSATSQKKYKLIHTGAKTEKYFILVCRYSVVLSQERSCCYESSYAGPHKHRNSADKHSCPPTPVEFEYLNRVL